VNAPGDLCAALAPGWRLRGDPEQIRELRRVLLGAERLKRDLRSELLHQLDSQWRTSPELARAIRARRELVDVELASLVALGDIESRRELPGRHRVAVGYRRASGARPATRTSTSGAAA